MLELTQLIGFGAGSSEGLRFVGGQTNTDVGATGTKSINFALTGGLAATPEAGDIVLVAVTYGSNNIDRDIAVTTGYTELCDLFTDNSFDNNFAVFYKIMPGTPDTSFTATLPISTTEGFVCAIHVWRGVDQSTPIDVTSVTASSTTTIRPDPAAITPVTPGAVIVVAGGGSTDSGAAYTSSDLSNFVTAFGDDTYDSSIGMGSYAWTSGSFNPAQFAGGGMDNNTWTSNSITIALRPA